MKRPLSTKPPTRAETKINTIKAMIESKCDINIQDSHGNTSLHLARDLDSVKLLLKNNADPNIQNKLGNTVLHVGKQAKYDTELIKQYILYKGDITIENSSGEHVLYNLRDNVPILKYFVMDKNINLNTLLYDNDDKTIFRPLLHDFLEPEYYELAQLLLENKADPNLKNSDGKSSLDIVDDSDLAILLLDHKAGPSFDQDNKVKWLDHPEVLYKMVECKADTSWIPSSKLLNPDLKNKTKQFFLEHGADPWILDSKGRSIIMSCNIDLDTTRLCIDAVIKKYGQDKVDEYVNISVHKEVALFYVYPTSIDIVILLLSHGADVSHARDNGDSVLNYVQGNAARKWTIEQYYNILNLLTPLVYTYRLWKDTRCPTTLLYQVTDIYKIKNGLKEGELLKVWMMIEYGHIIPEKVTQLRKDGSGQIDSLIHDTHGYLPVELENY